MLNREEIEVFQAIETAKEKYLSNEAQKPQQFNAQKIVDKEGNVTWKAEFCKQEGEFKDCTTILSGEEAIECFFDAIIGVAYLKKYWDEDYNETV